MLQLASAHKNRKSDFLMISAMMVLRNPHQKLPMVLPSSNGSAMVSTTGNDRCQLSWKWQILGMSHLIFLIQWMEIECYAQVMWKKEREAMQIPLATMHKLLH